MSVHPTAIAQNVKRFTRQLRQASAQVRASFATDLENATIFLMPHATESESEVEVLSRELSRQFNIEFKHFTTQLSLVEGALEIPANACVGVFFVKNAGGDAVKEIIQSAFAREALAEQRIRIAAHGLLLPRTCVIKCFSFAHGVGHYYRFRLALHKLKRVPDALQEFLLTLPTKCPNERFGHGPRASRFSVQVDAEPENKKEHSCITAAQSALSHRKFKSAHEDVEKFMIENDPETIATEVPLWLEPNEMKQFGWAESNELCLTGHIDVLRYEADGAIGIWDFKPDASNEVDAKEQVFLYALMLSTRTRIPIERFRCGFFDSQDAFVFTPSNSAALTDAPQFH